MKGLPWEINCDQPEIHVMPVDDLRPHICSRHCWCRPVDDDMEIEGQDSDVVFHPAMDLRHLYQTDGGEMPLH